MKKLKLGLYYIKFIKHVKNNFKRVLDFYLLTLKYW